MKSPALTLCAVFASLALLATPSRSWAGAAVIDTITGSQIEGPLTVNDSTIIAEQFITGADVFQMGSVTLSIAGISGTPTANVDLYAQTTDPVGATYFYPTSGGSYNAQSVNTSDWPATSPLYSIYSGAAPTANQLWTISASGAPVLDANTKYWIVFSVTGGGIDWNYTSGQLDIGGGQYLANVTWDPSQPANTTTNNLFYDNPMMVKVDPVPEPETIGLSILGIGFVIGMRRFRFLN